MDRKATLQAALEVWGIRKEAETGLDKHILPAELYELLIQPSGSGKKDELLGHLTKCPKCLQEYQEMVQSIEEAEVWDLALPKAAASELQWPKKIPTEGGKYIIEIRRSLAQEDKGVLTVKVEERYRSALEGKTVNVTDGEGRLLLRGQISDGEVSQAIDGVERMVPRFVIRPE